jgi:hypothetical protein
VVDFRGGSGEISAAEIVAIERVHSPVVGADLETLVVHVEDQVLAL